MNFIPAEWLVRRTGYEAEFQRCDEMTIFTEQERERHKQYVKDVLDKLYVKMEPGDELWWYANPRDQRTAGYAIARNGKVIGGQTILIS